MKLRIFPALVAALAAALTGCLTQHQTFHLNPDGSGKFELDMTVDTAMMGALGGGAAPNKDMGKEVVLQLLRGTQGVDAWADLRHETAADGKTKVQGTAFFKDINKLQMNAGEQAGGASAGTLVSKVEGGKWTVGIGLPKDQPKPAASGSEAKLPPDQIKAAMQQAKAQWDASKSLVGPMVEGAKLTTTIKAGGTIKNSVGFVKADDQTASLSFGGGKVISAIDGMINDPAVMEEALTNGDVMGVLRDQKRIQQTIMNSLTDGKGLPFVELAPGKPLFDYEAEVAKAKANQPEELKTLLEESAKPKGAVIRPPSPAPNRPKPAPAK